MLSDLALEPKRAFGVLFIGVAAAIFIGTILSEIATANNAPSYYHVMIWPGSFAAMFGSTWPLFRKAMPAIRGRMRSTMYWSQGAKALNAVCWAGPFIGIAAFPYLYQYLILLGIGLGNLSTYIMMKEYSGRNNREQLIVAIVSLAAVPAVLAMNVSLFVMHQEEITVMLSRILIGVAYAAGGTYALRTSE